MEPLAEDPWADRVVKDVPRLERILIDENKLWVYSDRLNKRVPCLRALKPYLLAEGHIEKKHVMTIL